MDKVYNIDEIFGSTNVKVQAVLAYNRCSGCYFGRDNPPRCFKPEFIGTCNENGQNYIYKNKLINYDKRRSKKITAYHTGLC